MLVCPWLRNGGWGECLKIRLFPRETCKFWAHRDGLSPTPCRRLPARRLGTPHPAQDSPEGLDPRALIGRAASPCPPHPQPAYLGWNHGVQQPGVRLGQADGQDPSEGNGNSAFPGSASQAAGPGQDSPGTPARGTGAGGRPVGRGRLGLSTDRKAQNGSASRNSLAHLPGKAGAARGRRSGSRETQRNHGETFSARAGRAAQARRARALPPRAAQQPRGGERPPRARSPLLGCGGSHFQEFPRSVRSSASCISPPSRSRRRRCTVPVRAPAHRAPRPPQRPFPCGCGAPGSAGWS